MNLTADPIEELRKYTVPVFLVKHGLRPGLYNGTGFFYQKNGQTYLVSNTHTFTGWNSKTRDFIIDADSTIVPIPLSNGETEYIKMAWGRKLIKTITLGSFVDYIDLWGIAVDLPPNAIVGLINETIDSSFFFLKPEKYVTFGYPTAQGQRLDPLSVNQLFAECERADRYDEWVKLILMESPNISDYHRTNLRKLLEEKYTLFTPELEGGRSGSPIFGEFTVTKGDQIQKVYKFMGVFYGMDPDLSRSEVINPESCVEYFESKM